MRTFGSPPIVGWFGNRLNLRASEGFDRLWEAHLLTL